MGSHLITVVFSLPKYPSCLKQKGLHTRRCTRWLFPISQSLQHFLTGTGQPSRRALLPMLKHSKLKNTRTCFEEKKKTNTKTLLTLASNTNQPPLHSFSRQPKHCSVSLETSSFTEEEGVAALNRQASNISFSFDHLESRLSDLRQGRQPFT